LKLPGGAALADTNGSAIKVTPGAGEVRIAPDGSVMQGSAAVAKLRVVEVEKPDALVPEGSGILAIGGGGAVTESTKPLEVGALEDSNAQPVGEMTELMTASRTFDAFQKVLDTMSEVDRRLVTTVPNPGE
jgi:flagellar basal body rod protein FlgG